MEDNNRVDEVIGLWTTVIFEQSMTLTELSNSPRLLELSVRQYDRLDTLLSSQLCAQRTWVRRCIACPKEEDSLLRCHIVVRFLEEEMDEMRQETLHAPEHVRQAIERRLTEVQEILHRYIEGTQARENPRTHADQHQAR